MSNELRTEEAIVGAYKQLVEERSTLANATLDRQAEVEQHDLVIKTLKPMDADRKCFQLVGDVLVEGSVKVVLPNLEKTRDQLLAAAKNIEKQFEAKNQEILAFEDKYKIRMKNSSDNGDSSANANTSQGVLVGS